MGKDLVMCRWFESKIKEDPDPLDETKHISGYVNM